jgi:hypothetical protein
LFCQAELRSVLVSTHNFTPVNEIDDERWPRGYALLEVTGLSVFTGLTEAEIA